MPLVATTGPHPLGGVNSRHRVPSRATSQHPRPLPHSPARGLLVDGRVTAAGRAAATSASREHANQLTTMPWELFGLDPRQRDDPGAAFPYLASVLAYEHWRRTEPLQAVSTSISPPDLIRAGQAPCGRQPNSRCPPSSKQHCPTTSSVPVGRRKGMSTMANRRKSQAFTSRTPQLRRDHCIFWRSARLRERVREPTTAQGQLAHLAGGPYVFVAEQHDPRGWATYPIINVTDSVAFSAAIRTRTLAQPFTHKHWDVVEAFVRDPDGRAVSLQATTSPKGVNAPRCPRASCREVTALPDGRVHCLDAGHTAAIATRFVVECRCGPRSRSAVVDVVGLRTQISTTFGPPSPSGATRTPAVVSSVTRGGRHENRLGHSTTRNGLDRR